MRYVDFQKFIEAVECCLRVGQKMTGFRYVKRLKMVGIEFNDYMPGCRVFEDVTNQQMDELKGMICKYIFEEEEEKNERYR